MADARDFFRQQVGGSRGRSGLAAGLANLFRPKKPKGGGTTTQGETGPQYPQGTGRGEAIREAQPGIVAAATTEEQQRLSEGNRMAGLGDTLSREVGGAVQQAENSYQNLFEANYNIHQQNQADIDEQQRLTTELPNQVRAEADAAKQDFATFANQGIETITQRADKALDDVSRGQGYALTAATQGAQANIENQVAAISADTNIPPSQKAAMISQVKMQGAMQVGSVVGETVLSFNKLQADTAVAMNGQITNAINQATSSYGALTQQGLQSVTAAMEGARQLGIQLTGLSLNDNQQYLANREVITSKRFEAQMTGNNLQLALLPERERPIPMFSQVKLGDLSMTLDAAGADAQDLRERFGMDMAFQMMQYQAQIQQNNILSSMIGALFPGKAGGTASTLVGGVLNLFQPQMPQPGFAPAGVSPYA